MRRFLIVAGMLLLLLVFLGSCVRPLDPVDSEYDYIGLGNFNTGLEINFSVQNEEGFHESPVHINKSTVIGKLIYRVENDLDSGASLYLKYEMLDNWRIKETRVSTALNNQSFPIKDGSIDPAQLSNVFEFDPAVSETEEIVIPLGILPEDSRGVYFAIVGYFERSSGSNSIQGYSFGPCVYFVPVRTNPDVELRPILKVDVEGKIDLSRVTVYDWEISKEATPEAIGNLKQGDSASVEYTLTATRLTSEATDTYTLTGIATVTNEGSLQAEQVGLKVFLLGKNGGDWVEIESKTLIETSSNTTVAASDRVGIGKPFTFVFNPGNYATVRIVAEAVDNWPELVDDSEDHLIPITPSSQTFIDESASIVDMPRNLVEFENYGFSVDHTGTWPWSVSPWVLNDVTGGTKKYSIIITNVDAPLGSYTLTNDATLTENDTLAKREDFARVLVSTPEPQEDILTLEATVTGSFRWDREIEYDWEIEKSVSPETIYLGIGEDADVTYTVNATRTLTNSATDTFSYKGAVEVGNSLTSNLTASEVSLAISLLESSDGGTFDVAQTSTQPIVDLAPGDKVAKSFDFSNYSFVSGNYYRVKAEVVSGVVSKTNTGALAGPISPNLTEYDKTATVSDAYMVPVGFDVTPDSDYVWPWLLSETPAATTYTFNIVNKEKETGEYKVPNTVTLVEDDTKQERSVDVTVTILVPAPGLNAFVEASVSREDKVEYDWTIDKSASPTVVTLGIGEEVPIDYTIKVTREPWETVDSTFTISVSAKVKNDGPGSALGVKIVLKITETGDDEVVLADGITMTEGEEKTFDRTFTTKTHSPSYTAELFVTSTNGGSPSDSDTADTPSDPNIVEYVDETADLEDLITSVPAGFSINPSTLDLSWPDLSDSATKTFSLTLKNDEALPTGSPFYLTNTATVTEGDNKDQFHSDNAEVKILVPEIKKLDILNEHDMEWDKTRKYSWIIDKSVTPQSLTLDTGESGTFDYTLVATRSVEETNVATFTGVATVTNTGNTTLTGIAVSIVLKDDNGTSIASFNTIITSLAPGSKQTIPYSLKFDPSTFVGPFKVRAAAADGASDSFDTEQIVPSPNLTEIDENAYVQDTFDSFSVAGLTLMGNQDREWSVTTSSWTQSYSVSVANSGAAPGQYSLHNTAVIYGEDTDHNYDSDEETVTIEVPETVELEAQVEAEFFWDRFKSYSWQLVKEVTPDSITYDLDEFEKEIDYTITATRTLESDVSEHSYQGAVTVTNNGLSEAENVKLLIELQYYDGTNWITIQMLPEVSLGSIPAGSNKVHNFGPSAFTPIDVSADHKVVVIASADSPANTADDFYSSSLGVTSSETTNATATLDDEFTYIPDGFQIVGTDPEPLLFPMELTNTTIVQFSITLREFSYNGIVDDVSFKVGDLGAYLSATVSGDMEGTYPGWCIEVNTSGIEGPYTIVDIYDGGAPDSEMSKINYILNTYRDGDFSGADYRHIQLAIWAIMEGSLDWSSWRTMFDPDVPNSDKPLVESIISTADDSFIPGCGDVVLIEAQSLNKQNLILETVLDCQEEFYIENTATLVTETDKLWDEAVVFIMLTPTDPGTWIGNTAWGGDSAGGGNSWWYYFDTEASASQGIYAGTSNSNNNNLVSGASVTYDQNSGTITIVLGPNMRLKTGSETVKIEGYAEGNLPTSRPAGGQFTHKGTDLVISVSPARYYAIHLDVEVKH